jgi:energy-coupling factor transporter ATP-binding protein EcfA2
MKRLPPDYKFAPVGHIQVVGSSFSGKSHYIKHLLKLLPHTHIFVFTMSPHDYSDPQFKVYTDQFDENIKDILAICEKQMVPLRNGPPTTPHIIIFDYFNDQINTATNVSYNALYTRGRHDGVRIINSIHHSKSIGPTARAQAKYVFMMCSSKADEIRDIASIFYQKRTFQLHNLCAAAFKDNKYNVAIIDTISQDVFIDSAPSIQDIITVQPPNQTPTNHNITIDVPLDPRSSIATDPQNVIYPGVTSNNQFGCKTAGQMVDNSTNNFNVNHNVKMTQLIESNQINYDIKRTNIVNNYNLTLRADMFEVKTLLTKPVITHQEKLKIVANMNAILRPSHNFTILDYTEGLDDYCQHCYKESYKPSKTAKMVTTAGTLLNGTNDSMELMVSGYSFVQSLFS